jgi:hypothetical protein
MRQAWSMAEPFLLKNSKNQKSDSLLVSAAARSLSHHKSHIEVLVVLIHALQLLLDFGVPIRRIHRQNRGGDRSEREHHALEDRVDPEPAKELRESG